MDPIDSAYSVSSGDMWGILFAFTALALTLLFFILGLRGEKGDTADYW